MCSVYFSHVDISQRLSKICLDLSHLRTFNVKVAHIKQTIYHKDIFVISECTQKQFYILHLSHYVPEGRASFQQSDRSTTGNYTLRIYSSTPIVANLWTVQVTVRYRDCSIEVLCT